MNQTVVIVTLTAPVAKVVLQKILLVSVGGCDLEHLNHRREEPRLNLNFLTSVQSLMPQANVYGQTLFTWCAQVVFLPQA